MVNRSQFVPQMAHRLSQDIQSTPHRIWTGNAKCKPGGALGAGVLDEKVSHCSVEERADDCDPGANLLAVLKLA